MRRSLFQQEHCSDESMWMESEAQQQSYAFQEEAWSSGNNYHKQFPGMHMSKHGAFATDSDLSMSKHRYGGGGSKLGDKSCQFQESMHKQHIDNGFNYEHRGGRKFPFGGHHQYFSEENEYEQNYTEKHGGALTAKVDEMRYERHNWGVNPYDRTFIRNMNHKPHWTAKGV